MRCIIFLIFDIFERFVLVKRIREVRPDLRQKFLIVKVNKLYPVFPFVVEIFKVYWMGHLETHLFSFNMTPVCLEKSLN